MLWQNTVSDNNLQLKRVVTFRNLWHSELEDIKGAQLSLSSPVRQLPYIKAYTICTLPLTRTLGPCFKYKPQHGRIG